MALGKFMVFLSVALLAGAALAHGEDVSRVDLVDSAKRLLSDRLQREYVKAWIEGRRAVFVDSRAFRSRL